MLLSISIAATFAANAEHTTLVTANPHMKADGFYNQHSTSQAAAQESLMPDIEMAALNVTLPMFHAGVHLHGDAVSSPFRIADLGCSQGKNSQRPISTVIDIVRQRLPDMPVEVLHVDLPDNDFTSLFQELESPTSYTSTHSEVYPSALGRSYYKPIAPRASLNLVIALVTLHWMPTVPHFGDRAWSFQHPLASPALKQQTAQLAHDYLTAFLLQRAVEVVSGGKLILSMTATRTNASGETTKECAEDMMEVLDKILMELMAEGIITPEELAAINMPHYGRTEGEVRAVLEEPKMVELYTVEKIHVGSIGDPLAKQHKEQMQNSTKEATGAKGAVSMVTREQAVASSVGAFVAVLEPCYLAPFQGEKADHVSREISSRMTTKLNQDPALGLFEGGHLYMVLTRK